VDLHGLAGTGPHGRIVRDDVEGAARSAEHRGAATGRAGRARAGKPDHPPERVPLGRIRQATVRRLADAAAVPVFTLTAEADMAAGARLRAELAELTDPEPTITDLVVSAAGRALREHPDMNASASDGAVLRHPRPHVGVAVDTPDGLIVPVVRDPGPPVAVAAATRELVDRARSGAATPADLDGATFTVSNLGMFGVAEFAAVIVPPQAGILAVGAVRELPRVRDGAVVAVAVMALTLTCDHRVVDGAQAARFLARLVALLERPLALMIEEEWQ
jgi:pyruvate dehydrogenase E2 component (dihydrolipoamide acetyltransferase)